MLDRLSDTILRAIALWKMEGFTTEEIASKLDCTTRTVERKLQLIRRLWDRGEASSMIAELAARAGSGRLTDSQLWRIDQICDGFETRLEVRADGRGSKRFSMPPTGPVRQLLLRELVLLDVDYRRRRGESPRITEYRDAISRSSTSCGWMPS